MNFLTLAQRTWQKCGLTGAGPVNVAGQNNIQARIVQYVADAYHYVQAQHPSWKFHWKRKASAPMSAGVSTYLPGDFGIADLRALERVAIQVDGQWSPITVVNDNAQIAAFDNTPVDVQRPTKVLCLPDGSLQFNTSPDQAYPLRFDYWRTFDVLSANASVPIIPEDYQWVIIWKALEYYANYDEDSALGAEAAREYKKLIFQLEVNQLPSLQFGASSF